MRQMRPILVILASLSVTMYVPAEEPGPAIPPELILERFAVNRGGDALLVPVKILGKVRLFIVDTACTNTIVDASLLAGEPLKVITSDVPGGEVKLRRYHAPNATVGAIPLGVESVDAMDLKSFREVSGYPIEGILGIDFLSRHVVHINFDRGELLLLKSLPADSGERVVIWKNSQSHPRLEAKIAPGQDVQFTIDTGWIGNTCGLIEGDKLKRSGDYRKVGSTLIETASGTQVFAIFQGQRISLGSFCVDRPILEESPDEITVLGLGFWSRFVVTFDFPNQNMYLKKGKGYARPDLLDLSGLHLLKRDGDVLIHSVDKDCPAMRAGLQAADEILTLGALPTNRTSLFEMRRTLSEAGPVACTFRRGSVERKLTLNLSR